MSLAELLAGRRPALDRGSDLSLAEHADQVVGSGFPGNGLFILVTCTDRA
jgi:hypothetical protein